MTTRHVRLLFVDDSEDDVFLFLMEMRQAQMEVTWRRVETRASLIAALQEGTYDIAIVDYILPGFSGSEAIGIINDMVPEVPAIVVSGKVSEEVVSALLQVGAYDYVLKDNRRRFATAVTRALGCRENALRARMAEQKITRLNRELQVKYKVASICLNSPEIDMYGQVMEVLLEALHSEYGVFGYINFRGDLVCPSVSSEVWEHCQMSDKSLVFPRDQWGGLWGQTLLERQALVANEGLVVPSGHVAIRRAVAVPLLFGDVTTGLLMVANKADKYQPEDVALVQAVADHIAPIVAARVRLARNEFDRQRALEELHRSEERYRELFANMVSGVLVCRPVAGGDDFEVVSANHAAERSLVYGEAFVGRRLTECLPGVETSGLLEILQRVSHTGKPVRSRALRYQDGSSRSGWYDFNTYQVAGGELVSIFESVTEQVLARQALEESEQRYALSVEGANDGIWDWNLRTDEVFFSPRAKSFLGQDNIGFPDTLEAFVHHLHDEDRASAMRALKVFVESNEKNLRLEFRMRHRDGSTRWLLMRGAAVFGDGGLPVRLAGSLSDVTLRRQAEAAREKALLASIERATEMESLLGCSRKVLETDEFLPVARHIFDAASIVIGAESGYVALLSEDGMENEVLFLEAGGLEAGGRDCFVAPELPMPIRGLREDAYLTHRAVMHNDFMNSEHAGLMPEGHVVLTNVMFAPLNIDGKTVGIMGLANKPGGFVSRDLRLGEGFGELCALALRNSRLLEQLRLHTETLEAQVHARTEALSQALLEARQGKDRIDAILDSVGDGLMVTDLDGRIVLINPAAEQVLQISHGEAAGKRLEELMRAGTLREKFLAPLAGERTRYEFDFTLEVDERSEVYHAATSIFLTPDGEQAGVITTIHDVTHEREVERMKDEFLSTAAHELRTPLTSIRGFAELLRDREDLAPEERGRFLGHICNQAGHLTAIVTDLLDLSRIESGRGYQLALQPLQPSRLVTDLLPQFEAVASGHQFKLTVMDAEAEIQADPDKLEQVLRNLLSNAVKYSPDGGLIEVICGQSGSTYQLTVTDQGIGMTDEHAAQVFDKFFRADSSSTAVEGTGLGMSIVKHIVEAHGGDIGIESVPGKGTSVEMTFPLRR